MAFTALWARVAARRRELHAAVRAERFLDAAALRDAVAALRMQDPYVRLHAAMEAAAAAGDFARAAALRDALQGVAEPPIVLVNADVDFGAWRGVAERRVRSARVTRGVSVEVEAFYDAERSGCQGAGGIAVFGSRVRVRNAGACIVQLVGRRWVIESFITQQVKEAEGCGVGAQRRQPVLMPGDEYVFETAAPVAVYGLLPVAAFVRGGADDAAAVGAARGAVVVGAISGDLEFVSGDVGQDSWVAEIGETFLVLPT